MAKSKDPHDFLRANGVNRPVAPGRGGAPTELVGERQYLPREAGNPLHYQREVEDLARQMESVRNSPYGVMDFQVNLPGLNPAFVGRKPVPSTAPLLYGQIAPELEQLDTKRGTEQMMLGSNVPAGPLGGVDPERASLMAGSTQSEGGYSPGGNPIGRAFTNAAKDQAGIERSVDLAALKSKGRPPKQLTRTDTFAYKQTPWAPVDLQGLNSMNS